MSIYELIKMIFIALFLKYIYFYYFLVVLGLRGRTQTSSGFWHSVTVSALPYGPHDSQWSPFSHCGARAWGHLGFTGLAARGMWDLPLPGIKPVSLALQGRFLTTVLSVNLYCLSDKL